MKSNPLPIQEQSEKLLIHLQQQLNALQQQETNPLALAKLGIEACFASLQELKSLLSTYQFTSQEEEIAFFKHVKPAFHHQFIYYNERLSFELRKPNGDTQTLHGFYRQQLSELQHFTEKHFDFYQYFLMGAAYLDAVYFMRKAILPSSLFIGTQADADPVFTSPKDYLVSCFLAHQKLAEYIRHLLEGKGSGQPIMTAKAKLASKLDWTDSKAALIELAYALQSNGSFNNGKASLQTIFEYFEHIFAIDLGNTSRTFQEILTRKRGHTAFLDKLTGKLMERIDKQDEHPKPR